MLCGRTGNLTDVPYTGFAAAFDANAFRSPKNLGSIEDVNFGSQPMVLTSKKILGLVAGNEPLPSSEVRYTPTYPVLMPLQ